MMRNDGKQPARSDDDGEISIKRESGYLIVAATQGGVETHLKVSDYNAWRLFGSLTLFLGVRLPASLAKRISL
jgi:hypothetical protein